jgi:hypothetical protein
MMIGEEYHDYEIFKNKHPAIPLQVENVLDLGYFGVENDFPTVKYVYCHLERKEKVNSQMNKRNTIESIPN